MKSPVPPANKRFLRNTLVSTLRNPIYKGRHYDPSPPRRSHSSPKRRRRSRDRYDSSSEDERHSHSNRKRRHRDEDGRERSRREKREHRHAGKDKRNGEKTSHNKDERNREKTSHDVSDDVMREKLTGDTEVVKAQESDSQVIAKTTEQPIKEVEQVTVINEDTKASLTGSSDAVKGKDNELNEKDVKEDANGMNEGDEDKTDASNQKENMKSIQDVITDSVNDAKVTGDGTTETSGSVAQDSENTMKKTETEDEESHANDVDSKNHGEGLASKENENGSGDKKHKKKHKHKHKHKKHKSKHNGSGDSTKKSHKHKKHKHSKSKKHKD